MRIHSLVNTLITLAAISVSSFTLASSDGCGEERRVDTKPKSASGAQKMTIQVKKDAKGHTTEQNNVAGRLDMDNQPGSIKHLYVISAYSGDVILYSTVDAKVTSSGKRLSPTSIVAGGTQPSQGRRVQGIPVNIGGYIRETTEVLQDDGTYGKSIPYIFWFDARGVYHQHYVTGGQIVHVSDQPMAWPKIIMNLEATAEMTIKGKPGK